MADNKRFDANIAFERLSSTIGKELAFFCLCAVYDKPYTTGSEAETWAEYTNNIGKGAFFDGQTDVHEAILSGLPTMDRWIIVWGDGYSESEYKQLDDLYITMTSQLDDAGGIDRQQEDTARTCARMALQRNKLIRSKSKDDIAMAKSLDTMIRDNLKDANMRKADVLPMQQQRPDGFVDALKKKLGLTMEMTKNDVMQAFFAWCRSKHYPETVDAEEHALMAILRTMQKNDDLPESVDLPPEFDLSDYEAQFEKEPNDAEKDVYGYLGIVRGEFKKGDGDAD